MQCKIVGGGGMSSWHLLASVDVHIQYTHTHARLYEAHMNWCQTLIAQLAWGSNPFACLEGSRFFSYSVTQPFSLSAKANSNRPNYRGANPFVHVMNQLDNLPISNTHKHRRNLSRHLSICICMSVRRSTVSANRIKWKRKSSKLFY